MDLQMNKQRIIRALWHPMGAAMCLVVVTEDSIIRYLYIILYVHHALYS